MIKGEKVGMNVLVIEDEQDIRRLLKIYLENEGYRVDEAGNGRRGLDMLAANHYDLVILDIMIPEIDGWSVCKKIRQFSQIPIIMVTARSGESERILGLELGADDYLVKPFSPKELVARIKAVFRRMRTGIPEDNSEPLKYGLLSIDEKSHRVECGSLELVLTPKEFDLLYYLAKNYGKVFKREHLLLEVWGYQYCDIRTVDTHVKQLREKLRNADRHHEYITTVWGVGYRFEVKDVVQRNSK